MEPFENEELLDNVDEATKEVKENPEYFDEDKATKEVEENPEYFEDEKVNISNGLILCDDCQGLCDRSCDSCYICGTNVMEKE